MPHPAMAKSGADHSDFWPANLNVKSVLWTLLRFFLVFSLFSASPAIADSVLKVGVAPDGTGSVSVATRWVPFLKQLEANSKLTYRFATAPDLLSFYQRVSNGDYDLIVTDSYLYTIFNQKHSLQFMAELGAGDANQDLVLVCHSDIKDVEQLDNTLLAIRKGEANGNLKLLDQFLTENRVSVLRDGVSSYEKILSSLEQKIHLAGLLPLDMAREHPDSLNILWQAKNQHHYVMSTSPSLDLAIQQQVQTRLDGLLTEEKATPLAEIYVLFVRQQNYEGELVEFSTDGNE